MVQRRKQRLLDTLLADAGATESSDQCDEYTVSYIRSVPWWQCKLWAYCDRSEDEADHAAALADDIREQGQIQPAIVRRASDPEDANIRYEVIAGSVRWRAARLNDSNLNVVIWPADDKQAFGIMVACNKWR